MTRSPLARLEHLRRSLKAEAWKRAGRIPNGPGYNTARWLAIDEGIAAKHLGEYGRDAGGLDERVVEYPWVFERAAALHRKPGRILDAGSVLNHKRILDHWRRSLLTPLSIVTLTYEGTAEVSDDVRYEFADLRQLPYRDEWFSLVLCLSTLEHVGLDNTIYGASVERTDPSTEAVRAMRELQRVTARGGTLLLSVPFGTRSNRGWFRVFDGEDLNRLTTISGWSHVGTRYFRAFREGWRESSANDARSAGYNEPRNRGGSQTAPEWVAAAEAVALIELARG
jgi:SAM-dependent methyltransferase